jgi:hypothetical protein
MSRLSELGHWLWLEAQLGTPLAVQGTVLPLLHRAKELARLLVKPYLTLYELRGQNQAGRLMVTYGGWGYAKPLLKSMLFDQEPVEREIGRVPFWRVSEVLGSLTSDLAFVESSQHLIRRLSRQSAVILPFRVQFILDLQGKWEQVEQRFRPNTRRNIGKAQRYACYEYEISRREQDVKEFYDTMYLPTVRERHGRLAAILPEREAFQYLRHGWLFLVKRDGVHVCGSLGYARKNTAEFIEMGVLNGDMQLMREGVVEAMNYLRIRWAHQAGYTTLNFGECWPFLAGIFQSKRKWGTLVSIPSHEHKQIWMRVQRNTPAVYEFLSSNPCIIINQGELQSLIVTDAPDNVTLETQAAWHKLYATPGLGGICIRSVIDLMEKP